MMQYQLVPMSFLIETTTVSGCKRDNGVVKAVSASIYIVYTSPLHVTFHRKHNEDVRVFSAEKHVAQNLSVNNIKLMLDQPNLWHHTSFTKAIYAVDEIRMKTVRHIAHISYF